MVMETDDIIDSISVKVETRGVSDIITVDTAVTSFVVWMTLALVVARRGDATAGTVLVTTNTDGCKATETVVLAVA